MGTLAGKSLEQRIGDTEERIRQLRARKQSLSQQVRQQERKDRTRRLIQIDGIMAKLGVDSVEKAQAVLKEVETRPEVRNWLRKVTERGQSEEAGGDS